MDSLVRRVPLRRSHGLRAVSRKQASELALRRDLKTELILETGSHCQHCGRYSKALDLVHLTNPLRGRRTDREHCEVWCRDCHNGPDGHRTEMPNGWAAGKI